MNYTADVSPNFNVTQIISNSSTIFLGTPYYNMSWPGHDINANITGFNEGVNATFHITSAGTTGVSMNILGHIQSLKLDGSAIPFGQGWTYGLCSGLQCTTINVGSSTTIFISWGGGNVQTSSFLASGYILANNGIFNEPSLTLISPPTGNVTGLFLFNTNGALVNYQLFPSPVALTANQALQIPASLQDNTNPSGTQTYYEQALVQSGTSDILVTSNQVTLNYGNFTNGNLNFNQTNTNVAPIYFIRKDLNTTDTRLSVIYPSTMDMECNLAYTFAFINKTYGPPLPNSPYQSPDVNSSFYFHNIQNEIITTKCTDTISKQNATYVLTQNVFPFQQQIQQFRNGAFGTQGNFGAFDFVSLGIVIISMIGFNRKNEAVGAFFSISIVGACAYFQLVSLPTFIIAAVIVVGTIAYTSTRKQQEAF